MERCLAEPAARGPGQGPSERETKCPLCREPLSPEDIVMRAPGASAAAADVSADADAEGGGEMESTKLRAVLDEIRAIDEESGGADKVVVFSQFTAFLTLIGRALERAGAQFARLDGSMTRVNRDKATRRFLDSADCNVFLISIKAGGSGLNLVQARHVLLTDLWWNSAVDRQAMDRVHRMGQTRPVRVVRFLVRDSIEERILALQEKKEALVAAAIGGSVGARSSARRARRTFRCSSADCVSK
jgi:SNF2 family DNA or RNA helicase